MKIYGRAPRLLCRFLGNPHNACCFTASVRPAAALDLIGVQFIQVVCRDLFAWSYLSKSMDKDPPFQNDHVRVRLARVINVLGAIAAPAPVNRPFTVNITDAFITRRTPPALGFGQRNSFSHVLSDLLVLAEENCSETAFPVNF